MQPFYYRREIFTPLKGFCTVVEEEFNVKKAAERLHITTAAIHQQIKALEDYVGYQVFDRTKRIYSLTYGGRLLYQQTAPLLQQIFSSIESISNEITKERPIEIRVAGHSTVISHILPKIIKKYEEKSKIKARFMIHDDLTRDEALDMLNKEQLDFVIYPTYDSFLDYETICIAYDDPVIAMTKDHRLANKEMIAIEDIAAEKLLYVNPKYITLPYLKKLMAEYHWGSYIEFSEGKWELLLHYVRAGLGVAFASSLCIPENDMYIIGRTMPHLFPSMPYNILRKKGTYKSQAIREFFSIIEEYGVK